MDPTAISEAPPESLRSRPQLENSALYVAVRQDPDTSGSDKICHLLEDMLATVADILQPRSFDELVQYGFDA